MIVLALDPALSCGFACNAPSGLVYGVWPLGGRGVEHPGNRLIRLRQEILAAHEAWKFERLAMEDASFGAINRETQAQHNELRGIIRMTAAELNVPVRAYKPNTIKKFATGFGHAKKDQMIRALQTHFGIVTASSDEADAVFILKLAEQEADRPRIVAPPVRKKRNPRPKETRLF